MAVSALRAPVSHASARPDEPGSDAARSGGPPSSRPLLTVPAMRLVTLLALVAFGAWHWMEQVEPAAGGRAIAATALAAVTALALLALGRAGSTARRRLGLAAVVVIGVPASLVAGGLPLQLLRPSEWGVATQLVSSGLDGLAGARVPYRGIDEGLRLVIPVGGILLAVVAALLAFWPRRGGRLGFPLLALLAAVTLYAVPAVILVLDQEYLRGALLTVLVLAFWRGERLARTQARAALVVAAVAGVAALAVAPALDGDGPWFDYEEWVQDNAGGRTESFDWTHDYSALVWPRDGREMLRIRARNRTYWKVETLDGFDGVTWDVDGRFAARDDGFGISALNRTRWTQRIKVSVRSLRTALLPLAGQAGTVGFPGRTASELRPGVWTVGRELRRGDAYTAEVYTPQPTREQLQLAGSAYGPELRGQTAFQAQSRTVVGTPPETTQLFVPGFKSPVQAFDRVDGIQPGRETLEESSMARTYRLSQRLLADSATPYEYVREIQRYLDGPGFTYDEAPPVEGRTLDGFLFDAKAGFCQQYSGAMALLLRMGGVPAHVVTGFAPGAQNKKTDEFVVRDVDAHSWVEAWFPRIGWVTFDPTPAAAPPRAQAPADEAANPGVPDVRDLGTTLAPDLSGSQVPEGEEELPWQPIAGGAVGLVALTLLGRWAWRRRGRPRRPAVLELEAALRGVGRAVPAGVTLETLEHELAGSPKAAAYVRALRATRYGAAGDGPTAAQRRDLRRALTHRRAPLARLRAWRALPPRLPRRGA